MSDHSRAREVLARRDEILAPLDPGRYSTLKRLVEDPEVRVVASFGGGSVPGLCGNMAFAGILDELGVNEHVEEVWGTSAGAAIGGPWASGTPTPRIYEQVAGLNHGKAVDIPWFKLAFSLLHKPFGGRLPDGLIRGEHFARAIDGALTAKTFEDCPTPFRCIACTDDGARTRRVFRRGPMLSAIFQSMSIPGIVIPRDRDGEETGFYDGGLVEKTPLVSPMAEHNRRFPDRKLLLIGTHFGGEVRDEGARGFIMRFLVTINALEDLVWEYQMREVRESPNVDLIILNPRIGDPALFDFTRVERNHLHAREVLADTLQDAKIALAFGIR